MSQGNKSSSIGISRSPAAFRSKVWNTLASLFQMEKLTEALLFAAYVTQLWNTGNTTNMAVHLRRHHKVYI